MRPRRDASPPQPCDALTGMSARSYTSLTMSFLCGFPYVTNISPYYIASRRSVIALPLVSLDAVFRFAAWCCIRM